MAKKKKQPLPNELKVRKETFGKGFIELKEIEPDSGKWRVTDFNELNLSKLSGLLYMILKTPDYHIVRIGDIKLNQAFSKDEIFHELANDISEEELKQIFLS